MTAIRIEQFAGMAPKLSPRLLPPNGAEDARNCRLRSGELRGVTTPALIYRFTDPTTIRTAYRIVDTRVDPANEVWMGFSSNDVDVVRAPLVNDSYLRHYWTGEESYVAYNTLDRIINTDPNYRLGVPAPVGDLSITVTGGSGDTETRTYAYTFINELGEESAPSPFETASGFIDGSWDLSGMDAAPPDMANRAPIEFKRIYRTVTGKSTARYYLVDEIPGGDTAYSDTNLSEDVVQNSTLQSFSWYPPPDELTGLTAHPNGFLLGFVGRDLYMSEPYRPHAWPPEYVVSTEENIVGLAIYNNMITVMTRSYPYLAPGAHPFNIAMDRSDSAEPCVSKKGIASTILGVMYPSPNGLVLFNERGPQIVTNQILTIEEWSDYNPRDIMAAQYGEKYIAFENKREGFKFTPAEPFGVFSVIDRFSGVENVITDNYTGQVWIIQGNSVFRWDPPDGAPLYYTWKSKQFDMYRPVNFGACIVKMKAELDNSVPDDTIDNARTYNQERMANPLNPTNFTAINASRQENISYSYPDVATSAELKYPVGGSPLVNLSELSGYSGALQIRAYEEDRLAWTVDVVPNQMMRMPSGFKAQVWQFELIGNVDVFSLAIAETAKELENV